MNVRIMARYYAGWADKIHGKTIPIGKFVNEWLRTLRSIIITNLLYLISFLSIII